MIKRILLICIAIFISSATFAKELTLTVDAPRVTTLGTAFRIEFAMNGKPDSFNAPDFKGFDVIAGPSTSRSTSISIMNGKTERVTSYTYTYVLVAREVGNLKIGESTATEGKTSIKTKPLVIEVINNNSNQATTSTQGQTTQGQTTQNRTRAKQPQTIAKDDILIRFVTSKRTVFEGEPILAQLKIFSRAELTGISGAKYPSFEGFWKQDLEVVQNQNTEREVYNNKVYDTQVIREYLLFPQKKGTITIEPMSLDFAIRVPIQNPQQSSGSLFDSFFGGSQYQNIQRRVSSPEVKIVVKPFTEKEPYSYKGAVGSFSIKSELNEDIITANNSATLKVTIKGSGNFPLISEPVINFPQSFEPYKVKINENINTTKQSIVGSKTFEFPFIARAAGTYTIDPITFSFFDINKSRFVTLKTDPIRIAITADTTRGATNNSTTIITGLSRDELKILGEDIRFIHTDKVSLKKNDNFIVTSALYIVGLLLMMILFVFSIIYFRKRIKASRDVARQRNKKASKAALKRLKEARKSMLINDTTLFYQNTIKAMWGYLGDKLNLQNTTLTKENISENLRYRGVSEDIITELKEIISDCEFAQYAPSGSTNMSTIYDKAIRVISNLENNL